MRRYILVIMTVVGSITNYSEGSPHHHDDEYRQARRLLKEARRAQRQQQQSGFNDFYLNQGSAQLPQFQPRPDGGSASPPNPILTPGSSGGNGGNFGTIGSIIPGGGSNFPPALPNVPSGGDLIGQIGGVRPPYPIEKVNQGVSTILNGVKSFDLAQILRGAFVFPRNENVRSVANTVLDSIFGAQKTTPNNGARY